MATATISLRTEHSEATRGALVKSARKLFGRKGYANVSLDEIVAQARVTKGALYHHFDNKRELFRAVSEGIERELSQTALDSGVEQQDFLAGLQAFLDACLARDVQQIVMQDSPSVLGWEGHRALQAKYGLGAIITGLEAAMSQGTIEKQPVDPLAHLILATLSESACMIAAAKNPDAARRKVGRSLTRLIEGLQPG
jgi:AcrR family transcriptional regulator